MIWTEDYYRDRFTSTIAPLGWRILVIKSRNDWYADIPIPIAEHPRRKLQATTGEEACAEAEAIIRSALMGALGQVNAETGTAATPDQFERAIAAEQTINRQLGARAEWLESRLRKAEAQLESADVHLLKPGTPVGDMRLRCGVLARDAEGQLVSEDGLRHVNCVGCLRDLATDLRRGALGHDG